MENYISNKNYLALYFNTIGVKYASALVLSFIGAFLYFEGLALPLIFLYFGCEFLLRAIISPFSGTITSRFGYKRTVVASFILLGCYFLALSTISTYPLIGFSSFILHSISRGIYYPTKHYMQAMFVRDYNRGRFLTLEMVLASLTGALAVLYATYSVTVWKSFLPVAIVAALFLVFSSFSVWFMLGNLKPIERIQYKDVINHCKSKVFRKDLLAFTGFGTNVAFNNVVVALLVFFVADSLKLFGIIMAVVFILEMLITLTYGRFIDNNRLESNKVASILQVGSYASFLLAFTPLLITGIKTVYNFAWNVFDSSFTTRFHSKIHRQGLSYSCAKEVILAGTAGINCFLLAGIAYIWEPFVFEASLVLASLGVVLAWTQFKD